jgi:hypothetical protein
MKDIIINTINDNIGNLNITKGGENRSFSIPEVQKLCDKISNDFQSLYENGQIESKVKVTSSLKKVVESSTVMGWWDDEKVERWDDADCFEICVKISRQLSSADRKLHQEIIKKCMPILTSIVHMEYFIDTLDINVHDISGIGYTDFESVGLFTFLKESFYSDC